MKYSFVGIVSALTLGLLPFVPWFGILGGALAPKYFLILLAVDLIALYAVFSLLGRNREQSPRRRFLLWGIGAVIFTQLLSAVLGGYFMQSFFGDTARFGGTFFLLHIALWAAVLGEYAREEDWALMRRAIIIGAGLLAVGTLFGVGLLGYQGSFLWFDLGLRDPFFGNETSLGLYFVLAAILGGIEFVKSQWRWKIVIGAALATIALSPIFLNTPALFGGVGLGNFLSITGFSKTSSIVFFGGAIFLVAWYAIAIIRLHRVRTVLHVAISAGAVIGAAMFSVLLLSSGSVVQQALTDTNNAARFLTWDIAKEVIAEKPLFGVGPERFGIAFEHHFTPALYTTGERVEGWFDRAHNVLLDTLATSGIVGIGAFAALIMMYLGVVYRARISGRISTLETVLLVMFPIAHLLQLQTTYDVVPTFALLGVIGGYALYLERGGQESSALKQPHKQIIALVLALFVLASVVFVLTEFSRQIALTRSLHEPSLEWREFLTERALGRTSDFEGMHTAGNLFVTSVFTALRSNTESSSTLENARGFLNQYLNGYERYLSAAPDHYRAQMNYAYLLLLQGYWGGEDRSLQAVQIIEKSYDLSPGNPLTYVLDIAANAYMGNMEEARETFARLQSLLPDAQITKDTEQWLEKDGPRTFLRIGNI